jgi:hypothetical protein
MRDCLRELPPDKNSPRGERRMKILPVRGGWAIYKEDRWGLTQERSEETFARKDLAYAVMKERPKEIVWVRK